MPQFLIRCLLSLSIATAASAGSASDSDLAQRLHEAVSLEQEGHFEAALAAYQDLLLGEHPSSLRVQLLHRTARLVYQLAHYREARVLFEGLLQDFPAGSHAAEALAMLGWTHLALKEPELAAKRFGELHAKFPQTTHAQEAAYWLAVEAADEQQRVTALSYVDWLLAELSDEVAGHSDRQHQLWLRALCLKCRLASEDSQWHVIQDLLAGLEGCMAEGPDRTRVLFWKAEAEFHTKNFDRAYQQFVRLQTLTIGMAEPWVAMVPLRRAQLAACRQKWLLVLEQLDELDRRFPEFLLQYEVDYLRGRAHAGRGAMAAARRSYRRALQHAAAANTETTAQAQWMIGETFFHQRDYERANQAYLKVLQMHGQPDWQARAALQAGKCWELLERWDRASEIYRAALDRGKTAGLAPQLRARLRWTEKQSVRR
ncbi:MAG: tetratricopeptide repeat protein [Pirellulales bacterium]|nr:tetratricopeptide repeat protein [Pirellulales bacterium]